MSIPDMTNENVDLAHEPLRALNAAAAGGLLGAIAASSCCMLPLVLFTLGAGGPWMGYLLRLAPYQPYFIALSIACLGCGYGLVYRASSRKCATDGACGTPVTNRLAMGGLLSATVLVLLAIAFHFLTPLLNS